MNVLAYPAFLNRNFPSKHLQFSNTPVQRKTLCVESTCFFFHLSSPQMNFTIWQSAGSKSLQHCHGTRKNYCPCLKVPSQSQGNRSWSLTTAGFVSSYRNVSKIIQQVGGIVRRLSVINLVSVQCAKWKNILSTSTLMLAQSISSLIPGNVWDIQWVIMERDQRGAKV